MFFLRQFSLLTRCSAVTRKHITSVFPGLFPARLSKILVIAADGRGAVRSIPRYMPSFPKNLFGGPLCSLYPQRLSLSHETDQDHIRERSNSVHTPKPSKEHSLLEVEWSCFQVQGQPDFLSCCDSGFRLSRTCTARQPAHAAAVGLICYPMHFLGYEVCWEG